MFQIIFLIIRHKSDNHNTHSHPKECIYKNSTTMSVFKD